MKVNWLVVDVGLWVYIITSLLNASLVASWVMWLAMILPLIHVCKKSNDEIKERKMLNDRTKKPGNTGLQGHNKILTNSDYTELIERTQEFRRKLPEFIYKLDVPLTVKVDVLERVIDEVPSKQMKLFATNLQAAYIARLAAIRFGGHNE